MSFGTCCRNPLLHRYSVAWLCLRDLDDATGIEAELHCVLLGELTGDDQLESACSQAEQSQYSLPSITLLELMTQDPSPFERSPLSGRFTESGITVIVEIFRRTESDDWQMEVTSLEEQVTDWTDSFASAHEAWEEFIYVINTEGIGVFL